MKGILLYFGIATPLAVLIFLTLSQYFSSWNGHVASVFPAPTPEATIRRVLIVDRGGARFEMSWAPEKLEGLELPVDALGIPPKDLSDRPKTQKSRYTLEYRLSTEEDVWVSHPTTTPQNLGIALGLLLVGFLVRNMIVAGSPFEVAPRARHKVTEQVAAGTVSQPQRRARGQKGPPPPKRRKGKGRR